MPEEGWSMQDGTPWPGNNPRDHPGMIQVFEWLFGCWKFVYQQLIVDFSCLWWLELDRCSWGTVEVAIQMEMSYLVLFTCPVKNVLGFNITRKPVPWMLWYGSLKKTWKFFVFIGCLWMRCNLVLQIRVSAVLTNGAYLLNVDCDHYFNNSKALKEAMCFMMDPAYGKKTCYVQFPQRFDGIDLHDRYANRNIVFFDVLFWTLQSQT